MTHNDSAGAALTGPAPAPRPEPSADAQIMAIWQALRTNPDLDARHALQAIDQLLDQRITPGGAPAQTALPCPQPAAARVLEPGSPCQHAVLAGVLRALLAGDPG
jgi:hypothetical protein